MLMKSLWLFSVALWQSITFAQVPERIVSAGGGVTEIICALGYEAKLVGVDTSSLYPPSVQSLRSEERRVGERVYLSVVAG